MGQQTVSRWLTHFREAPECVDAPALPSADTLDAIAADIKAAAKAEVKDEAADEIKAEVEAIRKDFTPSERVAITDKVRAEIGNRQGQRTDFTLAAIRDSQGCAACKNCEWMKEHYVCTALCTPVSGADCDIADEMLCGGEAWEWDGTTLPEADDQPPLNGAEVKPGQETRDIAAKAAGFASKDEYRRAKTVVEHGTPELVAAMDNDEGRIIA